MSHSTKKTCNTEDELTRLALAELTREAERGKLRSSTMGVTGWMKPKLKPNKRFLKNTLLAAVKERDKTRRMPTSHGNSGKQSVDEVSKHKLHSKRKPHSELGEKSNSKRVKNSSHDEFAGSFKFKKWKSKAESPKR